MRASQVNFSLGRPAKTISAALLLFVGVYLVFNLTARAFSLQPFIRNGSIDRDHTYVVDIQIIDKGNKTTFCSGTVIGANVILTAAHCISGHQKDSFSYFIDTEISKTSAARAISEAAYPGLSWKGPPQECGFCYNGKTFIHDIGLLFTKEDIPASTSRANLPKSRLDWLTILRSQGKGLVFSGYGLTDPIDDRTAKQRNLGKWTIDRADDWRFFYQEHSNVEPLQSTCNGDSGGPTIYAAAGVDTIIGVTSTGDSSVCTYGNSTRVDAYLDWINGGYMQDKSAVGPPPPNPKSPDLKPSG